MDEPSSAKRPSVLTIDRAAFLLLRVKRAFKKKRQQRKEKQAASAAAAAAEALGGGGVRRVPPPLLRSRTLPAIVVPGLSILHAQIDPQRSNDLTQSQLLCRGVSAHKVCGLRPHAPRISFTGKDESDTHELRRKSASSRLGSSPRSSIASEERADGLVLRVPTPRGSVSSTSSSTSSRLTRLLTQGVRATPEDVSADAPRRLSWERRESFGQLPRSASIDSVVEAAICARHSEPQPTITLQLPARADRALSLVSPAVGRRTKSQRGQTAHDSNSCEKMGIHCQIRLYKSPAECYRPGSTVRGEIIYAIDKETKFSGITTYLFGKAKAEWNEGRRHFEGRQKLYKYKCEVFKDSEGKIFTPNSYIIPFIFYVPSDVPPTYNDKYSYVKHRVRIKFNALQFFKRKTVYYADLVVHGNVIHSGPTLPALYGFQKEPYLFSNKDNLIRVKVTIDKSLVQSNDEVNFDCEVTNNSKLKIYGIKINLWKKTTYISNCKSKKHIIKKVKDCKARSDAIDEFSEVKYSAKLCIPNNACTIQHCTVLKRIYWFLVTAKLPIPHSDAYVKIPVSIGETSDETQKSDFDITNKSCEMKVYEPEEIEGVSDEPPSYWEVMNEENDKLLDLDFDKTKNANDDFNFEKAHNDSGHASESR